MKRPVVWLSAALALMLVAAAVLVATRETPRKLTERAGRVLVISLPYVTWSDLEGPPVPNIDRLIDSSSVASLTTRTIGRTDLVDGYLTMSAGVRATGGDAATDGAAFSVDEEYGHDVAADVFRRQTGTSINKGIVHLGLPAILDANDEEGLDALVGVLGDALHRAGYSQAVVANGDGGSPISAFPVYERMAASALMRSDGVLSKGRVDAGLLSDAPEAPFGRKLNVGAAVEAFNDVWHDHSVVLVEASDLVRATRYQPLAVKGQRRDLFKQALRSSDRLVGELLKTVDLKRDAVIVLSPVPSVLGSTLTVVSVHAPGIEPSLLRSPSLRRPGFVQIVDVAPTILELVGVKRPTEINGRPMTVASTGKSAAERRAFLVDEIDAAEYRDQVSDAVIITFIALQALLALGAVLVLIGRLGAKARARVRFAGLALLAFVPAVYLARLVPFHEVKPLYPVFLIVAACALAALYRVIGWRHTLDPPIIGLATIVVLLVGDVILGARLQLDSAFGYTPTVGVRISGFGNISYAALGAAAVILAGLVTSRVPGRAGVQIAIGIMGFALLADAVPIWGADVGGVLSMIPAFGITAALLLGKHVRPRLCTVLLCVAAALVGLVIASVLDLSQAEEQRTHLGRFLEEVNDNGFSTITDTISHKLSQNLATITSSLWGVLLPFILAFVAYLSFGSGRLGALMRRIPELRAALIGFTVLAVLGYFLNDSGINIPSMMLAVLSATLVTLLIRRDPSEDDRPTRSQARSQARSQIQARPAR
ncbi:MAG: hypothetical protein EXQ79_09305 [Acidimicrobiia bacterium]|nr:hypothetical protein [Acidimicrobiia bacterium]